ncbi:MAG: hypothetical protein AB8G95_30520, partial [Anaerolineae bacterium]
MKLEQFVKFGILGIFLFFVGGINLTTSAEATGQNELVQQTSCVSGLMQEAEDGVISGNRFTIGTRADASGNQFVYVPDGLGNISGSVANNPHYVSYCFDVPADGFYEIEGWVSFEGTRHLSDSFFIQVDDAPANGYLWDTLKSPSFSSDLVSDRGKQNPVVVNLTAGQHIVKVHLREDGTMLDKLALLPIGGQPTPTSTAAPTDAPATATTAPPTATDVPATATPVQPTATAGPPTTTPDPSACGPLMQEAEDGILAGRFVVGNRPDASGNQYIYVPDQDGNNYSGGL